jgi:4-hydroxymandelate oxidase
VFKALALGARAVLIGRPVFWGLAGAAETGVRRVLERRRDEVDATLGMCGRTTGASVDRECLVGVSPLWAVCPPTAPFR